MKKIISMFLVGLILAAGIFYLIGIDKIFLEIMKINFFYYFLAIFAFIGTLACWTLRWHSFLQASNNGVGFKNLFLILIAGLGVNNLTPIAKMGGEPVRAYLLKKKENIYLRKGFATIAADISMEGIVSVLVVLTGIFLLITVIPSAWFLTGAIALTALGVILLFVLLGIGSSKRFVRKIIDFLCKRIERIKKIKPKILSIFDNFQRTFRKSFSKKTIFKSLFFSLGIKFFDGLRFLFIFLALFYEVNLIQILIIIGAFMFLNFIPLTPGSLGILEGGMISVFLLLNIPLNIAASVIFLERLISFWGILVVGMIINSYYGIKFSKINLKKDNILEK